MITPIYQCSSGLTSTFKSYSEHRKNYDNYSYYTTTRFFREDMNWTDFVLAINKWYKDVPKVNIICQACSDGEEPFSLALKLNFLLKDNAQKFLPIIAKDFDRTNIYYAKKGIYSVDKQELQRMENECGIDLYKFIKLGNEFCGKIPLTVRDNLKEKVAFSRADILKDVHNIPSENTILMTRNFWPYLPAKKQEFLAEELSKQLAPSSRIVLGFFDTSRSHNIHKFLEKYGFEPTEIEGVLKKSAERITTSNLLDARCTLNKLKAIKSV